jgi:UDP-2,3-diacylglucosamine hydrolase
MNIVTLSDLHLKNDHADSLECWAKFIHHPVTKNAQVIVLIGDVFDLMVGEKSEYLKEYSFFFSDLEKLIKDHKKIYFIEGNHDFHLKKLFEEKGIKYFEEGAKIEGDGVSYFFIHGDELERTDWKHQLYRKIIKSSFFRIFAKDIVSFKGIQFIGKKLGTHSQATSRIQDSDKREKIKIENRKRIQNQFNTQIKEEKGKAIVISGHIHIKDYFREGNLLYGNNGFPVRDQVFIHISKEEIEFISLS